MAMMYTPGLRYFPAELAEAFSPVESDDFLRHEGHGGFRYRHAEADGFLAFECDCGERLFGLPRGAKPGTGRWRGWEDGRP